MFENILAIVADFRHVHGANDPHVAREPKDHITAETQRRKNTMRLGSITPHRAGAEKNILSSLGASASRR